MGSLLSIVTNALGGVWGYVAAGALSAIVAGGGIGWTVHRLDAAALESVKRAEAEARLAAAHDAAAIQKNEDAVSLARAVADARAQQKIAAETATITKEAPIYVSPRIDARDCISYGLVRVLDAAALGVDPAGLSLPAGQSDDACAPVEASVLATSVAANYGVARANAEELSALQAWVKEEAAAAKGERE